MFKMFSILSFAFFSPHSSFAGGFEKATLISAKDSGRAGAVASVVDGPSALIFNPAGLASKITASEIGEVELHLGVADSSFNGPITTNNENLTSKNPLSVPAGILGRIQVNEELGIGMGVYVAGGTQTVFEKVNYSAQNAQFASLTPDNSAQLSVIEVAAGPGYQITPNLSIGATLRVIDVQGKLASSKVSTAKNITGVPDGTPLALVSSTLSDLKDRAIGHSAGITYTADSKKWGLGASYRSKVNFSVEGSGSGSVVYSATGAAVTAATTGIRPVAGQVYALSGGNTTVENVFPARIALDGHYQLQPTLDLFAGITYTNYSANQRLDVTGSLTNGLTSERSAISDIEQKWKDQYNYRIALEKRNLAGSAYTVRGGYILTSQVTNTAASRATFASPATGHTFILGGGRGFLEDRVKLDLALEHSFAEGDGKTPDESSSALSQTLPKQGTFSSKVTEFYASTSYHF